MLLLLVSLAFSVQENNVACAATKLFTVELKPINLMGLARLPSGWEIVVASLETRLQPQDPRKGRRRELAPHSDALPSTSVLGMCSLKRRSHTHTQ